MWRILPVVASMSLISFGALGETLIDFEDGVPDLVNLQEDAHVTNNPAEIINGKASLKCETSGGEWHEFLYTTEKVRFQPNTTYVVTFQYRILDPGESKTRFYSLMRSRTDGPGRGEDLYAHPWEFTREQGALSFIHRIFEIGSDPGYYLIMGIRKRGTIVIDDILIRPMKTKTWAVPPRVDTFPTDVPKMAKQFEQLRREQNLTGLLEDMLVILCDEGSGQKAQSQRDRIIRELRPDFVDWNPIGPLAQNYGIRTSRGGIEYQEYYKHEGEDVWNSRYERFANSGFDYTVTNMIIQEESWGEGGYFTTHNGENWHEYFIKRLFEKAGNSAAICQDNISCIGFERIAGGFSPPAMRLFREHLRKRYPPERLGEWGIEDLDSFSAQEYFLANGTMGEQAWQDPVLREFIKFQYISHLLQWADVVQRVKDHARKQSRLIPAYGNQINAWGTWPFAVAISQMCDVVEIEVLIGAKDKVPRRPLTYKTGRAGSYNRRPVWARGPIKDNTKERSPMLSTSFWTVIFAEGLANGGVRDISLGVNAPWTGDPSTLDYIDDPGMNRLWKAYADMLWENRTVFSKRDSLARVALVYSYPTLIFRRFRPLNVYGEKSYETFTSMSDMMEKEHVPYDVIVFGHPEIWDDTPTLEQLDKYDVIMLPWVEALTDDQADALREYAAGGGTLVFDGRIGIYDENMNLRQKTALEGVRMVHVRDLRRLNSTLQNASPVDIKAPESVSVNAWRSREGGTVSVHLVDYDVDVRGNAFFTRASLPIKLKPPAGMNLDSCYLIAPGKERVQIPFEREGEWLSALVPELDGYAVLAFTCKAEFDAANAAAVKRREEDRHEVMREARRWNLY